MIIMATKETKEGMDKNIYKRIRLLTGLIFT